MHIQVIHKKTLSSENEQQPYFLLHNKSSPSLETALHNTQTTVIRGACCLLARKALEFVHCGCELSIVCIAGNTQPALHCKPHEAVTRSVARLAGVLCRRGPAGVAHIE
jgi:hypothetical protein